MSIKMKLAEIDIKCDRFDLLLLMTGSVPEFNEIERSQFHPDMHKHTHTMCHFLVNEHFNLSNELTGQRKMLQHTFLFN